MELKPQHLKPHVSQLPDGKAESKPVSQCEQGMVPVLGRGVCGNPYIDPVNRSACNQISHGENSLTSVSSGPFPRTRCANPCLIRVNVCMFWVKVWDRAMIPDPVLEKHVSQPIRE